MFCTGAGIAQSVQRLATGWTVHGSNAGGSEIFAPIQTDPGAHQPPTEWVPAPSRG